MVFNAIINNISVISWEDSFIGGGTRVPGENHRPGASHYHTLSYNIVHLTLSGIRNHNISGDIHRLHM
jgi:hypothetical protein